MSQTYKEIMYTNSVENEREFLMSIWESFDINMGDGETTLICECPKCHIGSVICRCTHDIANGKNVPFRYCIKTYDDPEEALAPTVTMHIIDIDLSKLI